MEYKYCDGLCSGGRYPRLYLAKGVNVVKFTGSAIPDVVGIKTAKHEKCGKWSNTTYELILWPGVRAILMISPLHGIWGEHYQSWGEVVSELQLPIEVAKKLVASVYPKTADRLDKIDQLIADIESQGDFAETVIISFGSPTNRSIANGFWSTNKTGSSSNGVSVEIAPGDQGWYTPTVVSPAGAKITNVRHSPGVHGGYYYIEVLVPVEETIKNENHK